MSFEGKVAVTNAASSLTEKLTTYILPINVSIFPAKKGLKI